MKAAHALNPGPAISRFLDRNQPAFIFWALIASFGAYFCMYAFRKPFSTGLYEDLALWGISYKTVLILTQVAGYMSSKFIGIKIISELKPSNRAFLALLLVGIAHLSLLLFGITPYPYNFIFLFFNGLPLGMMYGVLFNYLEGRRFTETIVMGLGICIIIASGILKTVYIEIHGLFPGISEFWMPFVIGCIFLPLFFFFIWMMSVLPPPNEEDIAQRTVREPMTSLDKQQVIRQFGIPVACYVLVYAMLTMVRDFRDNFAIEIWNEIDAGWKSSVLAQTELISGVIVLGVIGSLSMVKDNRICFALINGIMLSGLAMAGVATFLYKQEGISGYHWFLMLGTGTFLAYITAQTVLFERLIALFRIKSNAGFLIYLCDSTGYLGSVGLLVYKEFFARKLQWSETLSAFVNFQTTAGILLMVACLVFLAAKARSAGVSKAPGEVSPLSGKA